MKKVFKILTLITLILTIVKITDTYAKYYTKATAITEQEIGKWEILVNSTDIYSETGQVVEFTLDTSNGTSSDYVSEGKVAPGSTLSADIEINPSGTDVAVRYDIQIDNTDIASMNNIEYEISAVDEDDAEIELIKTAEHKYTGTISLADVQEDKKVKVTVGVQWNNTGSTDNEDTELASTYGEKIELPIKVTCTQYLGETITSYT